MLAGGARSEEKPRALAAAETTVARRRRHHVRGVYLKRPLDPMTDLADPSPSAAPLGRILTLEDVAELVQLSTRTVRRAILAGELEASQLTPRRGGWRIREAAVGDWL